MLEDGRGTGAELRPHLQAPALRSWALPRDHATGTVRALLAAVAILVRDGVATLPAAVRLASTGAALVPGLAARGAIAPRCADFALIDDRRLAARAAGLQRARRLSDRALSRRAAPPAA